MFYDYTDDGMRGSKLEGEKIDIGSYSEQRYGATLSGPILKDRLFFFLAYEKLDGVNLFDRTESDIQPRPMLKTEYEEIPGQKAHETTRREAWRWLVWAALAILLVEWYIYNRRVYL